MLPVTCIDVGASVYPHPRWVNLRNAPSTNFILIDPDAESLGYAANWAWQSKPSVIPTALWSRSGTESLFRTATPTGSSLFEPKIPRCEEYRIGTDTNEYFFPFEKIEVSVTTLDYLSQEIWPSPIFLKIDCQGGELEVLKGAEGVLRSNPPVLIELETSLLSETFYSGAPSLHNLLSYLFEFDYELLELKVIERTLGVKSKSKGLPHECDAVFTLKNNPLMKRSVNVRWALFIAYIEYERYSLARSLLTFDRELHEAMVSQVGSVQVERLLQYLR